MAEKKELEKELELLRSRQNASSGKKKMPNSNEISNIHHHTEGIQSDFPSPSRPHLDSLQHRQSATQEEEEELREILED